MVMFSATWPVEVHKLAEEYMDPNPVKVLICIIMMFWLCYLAFLRSEISFVLGGCGFRGFGCQP